MNEIEIKNVTKYYKSAKALDGVSLTFEKGKIYGLLGRNGAGKSTLIKAICNKIFISNGEILIDGIPSEENERAQCKVQVMSETNIMPNFKIKDAFKLAMILNPNFDIEYAEKLANLFALDLKKKVKTLSTGYSSILKFILAMSSNAPYIFLDEPVLGLDATHREFVYKVIISVNMNTGAAIIISTHIIEEISNLIEDIVILTDGKVIEKSDKQSLVNSYYLVSGPSSLVEEFSLGKKVVSEQTLCGLANKYIKGPFPTENVSELTFSKVNLQELFVKIGGGKEEEYYESIINM